MLRLLNISLFICHLILEIMPPCFVFLGLGLIWPFVNNFWLVKVCRTCPCMFLETWIFNMICLWQKFGVCCPPVLWWTLLMVWLLSTRSAFFYLVLIFEVFWCLGILWIPEVIWEWVWIKFVRSRFKTGIRIIIGIILVFADGGIARKSLSGQDSTMPQRSVIVRVRR